MLFDKKYTGVYITLCVFGAGTGLLIGAFVDLKTKRRLYNEEMDEETEQKEYEKTAEKYKKPSYTSEDYGGVSKKAEGRVDDEEGSEQEDMNDDRYASLMERYEISSINHQLYRTGVITIDQLEEVLKNQYADKREVFDYVKISEPKSDTLVPTIDEDPFIVYNDYKSIPKTTSKDVRIIYNPADDTSFRLTDSNQLIPITLKDNPIVNSSTFNYAIEELMSNDGVIYVHDLEKDRVVIISLSEEELYEEEPYDRKREDYDEGEY